MILHNPLDFSMSGYTDVFYGVVKKMMAERTSSTWPSSTIHRATAPGCHGRSSAG